MKRRLDSKTVENGGWAEGLGGGETGIGDGDGRRGEEMGGAIGALKFALPWS